MDEWHCQTCADRDQHERKFLNLSFTYGMLGPTNFALMLFKRFFIISHFFRTLNTLVSRRLFRCSICFLIWMVKNNSSDALVPSSQWFIRVGERWKNENDIILFFHFSSWLLPQFPLVDQSLVFYVARKFVNVPLLKCQYKIVVDA